MTSIFIYVIFGIIVLYDIAMVIYKKEFITTVFRKWYREKPIVPYMVGVVFIGHFQALVNVSNVCLFIILSAIYLVWCIIMSGTNIKWTRGWYVVHQKYFFIPMILGAIIGTMWRT